MHNRTSIKSAAHRLAYSASIILPLTFLWDRLHNRDYHPKVDGIMERIYLQKMGQSKSLFVRLGERLNHPINLKNKSVLEIGHGGGWYLAEALDAGAAKVSGLEISDEINKRAKCALEMLDYRNFSLFLGNGKDLLVLRNSRYDFIFSITVLQHMPTRITKKYLRDIANFLASDGMCVIQTLNSYGSSMKRLSGADLFSVAYSKREFDKLILNCGLQIIEYAQEEYGSPQTYWGIYLLKKSTR